MNQSSPRTRHDWIDAAKAVSIFLVVMYHARHLSYMLDWKALDSVHFYWEATSIFFKPLRMPLFFLISGILISSSMRKEWDEISAKRVYRMYYVYAVWAVLFATTIPTFPYAEWSIGMVTGRLFGALGGVSLGWYIWALGSFFLFGWVTRDLPAVIPLGLAAIAAIGAIFTEDLIPVQQTSMLRCLLFFMIGVRLPQLPLWIANLASGRTLLWTFCAFCAVLALSIWAGSTFNPFVDSLAVASGIMAAKLGCERWSGFSSFGASFAKLTLPVYLIHFPVLIIILKVATSVMSESLLSNYALAITFPLIAAILSVGVSLALYRLTIKLGAYWLFDLPQPGSRLSTQPTG